MTGLILNDLGVEQLLLYQLSYLHVALWWRSPYFVNISVHKFLFHALLVFGFFPVFFDQAALVKDCYAAMRDILVKAAGMKRPGPVRHPTCKELS